MRLLPIFFVAAVGCKGTVTEAHDLSVEPRPVPRAPQGGDVSNGGGRVNSANYHTNVVVGDPASAVGLRSDSSQISGGVGIVVRERH